VTLVVPERPAAVASRPGPVRPTVMQWVKYLLAKIEDQAAYAAPFEKRYRNEYVVPFIANEYRSVYGAKVDAVMTALEPPRTGMAAIGIDALVERLTVLGAKPVGDDADSKRAAKIVEDAWFDSDLDVMQREAWRESMVKRTAFGQVVRSTDGRAVVGIEAPEQMAVHRESGPPYDVDAALKVSTDEWTGRRTARLWLSYGPGCHREIDLDEGDFALPDPEGSDVTSRWLVRDDQIRPVPVPVVEFSHQARLLAAPQSEIEPIATLVDICDLVEGLLVFAGHFGAVPIRWATGVEVMRDPKDPTGRTPLLGADGKPVMGFTARADHNWLSTSKETKFGQLQPADLASFVTWAEHAASRVRAKTRVASSYYYLDLKSHMNAELLKTDEAPMVRRIRGVGENGSYNQALRRLHRHILAIEAPSLRGRTAPRWESPETRVEAQASDSFSKAVSSGLGVRVAAEESLGWSPEKVERAVREAEAAKDREAARSADPYLSILNGSDAPDPALVR
jgi:hypothetical protein